MKGLLGALAAAFVVLIAHPAAADLTLTRGGDWQIQVKAGVNVCALGQCQSDSAEDTDVAFLPAGSLVRMEAQVFSCNIPLGDYGDFVPGKRGRIKVKILQREELANLVRNCSPYPQSRLGKVKGSEILAADGASFESKVRIRLSFKQSGQTVGVTVTAKAIGTLLSEATGSLRGDGSRVLPDEVSLGEEIVGGVLDRALRSASRARE